MSAPRAPGVPRGPGRWLAIAASVVVVAAIVAAIAVTGPPSAQRELRLDRKRTDDLQRITLAVRDYARRNAAPPPDLATLAKQPGHRLAIADPKDGTPYGYEVTGPRSVRLCATFATDTAKTQEGLATWGPDDWSHAAGRQCFDRQIGDPKAQD